MPVIKIHKSIFGIKSPGRRKRVSDNMPPFACRQIWALIRRYIITAYRSPCKSITRIVLWPGFILGICYYLLTRLQADGNEYGNSFEYAKYLNYFLLAATYFHFWSFSEWLVTDKAISIKSLMISMGLKRSSYYCGNFISFMACVYPVTIGAAIISSNYVFKDTKSSTFSIILLFTLFTIHLAGTAFAMSSFLTSTNYVPIIGIPIILEYFLFEGVLWLVKQSVYNWLRALILFMASASPFLSTRLFCYSYLLCKNCDETKYSNEKNLASQPTYLILLAMAFWTLIAFAFARWWEEVCPWQGDSAVKSPFFCCQSSQYEELPTHSDDETIRGSRCFERVLANRDVGISIIKVSKTFQTAPVVDDITFNIYKGETTLLLGHNGAGKTTLMNIILGKLTPDKGRVLIEGSSSLNRFLVGVCPQTSILDDNLSVRQHLELFADIKSGGLSGADYTNHINSTLEDVSLTNHSDKLPNELSGGMKRKLSLAMAFVGNSSILILDEPSSGLDPDSRVFVWNAIRRYRAHRTVLLSTQHMEEADYLGDRIAIMNSGRIVCCGSSIFLNNTFGTGYKLRVECPSSNKRSILSFVRKYFANAKPSESDQVVGPSSAQSASGKDPILDVVLELKDDRSKDLESNLIRMLEDIETNSAALHIKSYGLKASSIEDVMLNTNRSFTQDPQQESVQLTLTSTGGHIATLANVLRIPDTGFCASQKLFLYAFIMKHVRSYKKDWKSILFFRLFLTTIGMWAVVSDMNTLVKGPIFEFSISEAVITSHLIYYPVLERVSKFKTMQLTSHANFVVYWLSQLIIDLATVFYILFAINIFLVLTFNGTFIIPQYRYHLLVSITTLLFGIAAACFAYFVSTMFTDDKTAYGSFFLIYCTSGIFTFAFVVVQAALSKDLRWLSNIFNNIFVAIFPTEAFRYVIYGSASKCYIGLKTGCSEKDDFSPVIHGIICLILQIIVYSALLCVIERFNLDPSWYFKCRNFCSFGRAKSTKGLEGREVDKDVVDESTKAIRLTGGGTIPSETYSLVAADLNKSYVRGIKVIDHLSFSINRGECFGLLGVNGAGKSTTFSMIVAETKVDSGKIWLNGHYQTENVAQYRHKIGYDPQSNPEMSLSVVDALYLMARLRRVNAASIPMLVNSVIALLDMNEHSRKSANELSGGTKRKLALGMSLIGNPQFLALDEPTAGVDPIARRSVWQLLRSLRMQNGASIMVSSHAMEECEAICDRISIMANGRLRCIGTFLHLRSKFAKGCTIKIQWANEQGEDNSMAATTNAQLISDLQRRLESEIGPSVKLTDTNVNSATFNITDNQVKRSALFKIMREFRLKHPKMSYILNDCSLEDIFISLAREQQELEAREFSGNDLAFCHAC